MNLGLFRIEETRMALGGWCKHRNYPIDATAREGIASSLSARFDSHPPSMTCIKSTQTPWRGIILSRMIERTRQPEPRSVEIFRNRAC